MPSSADSQPDDPELDFEIDLEPTLVPAETAEHPRTARASGHVALVTGRPSSLGSEVTALLRERLQAAALALLAISAPAFLWLALTHGGRLWVIPLMVALRFLLALGVYALMRSAANLTLDRLRWVEYALFGGATLLMMTGQYFGNREFIREGDLLGMVSYERQGVLQICILMMLYSVFIPNGPKRAARFVLTMAMGPLLVLSVALERDAVETLPADRRMIVIQAVGNALSIMFVAGLSIYCTKILNGLRSQLREARRFGQYQLGALLGSGGMGEVYLAEHQLLKRPCALKLIRSEISANSVALARFEREVRSAARLSNPHVVEIFDYGHADDGTFYYVMEFLTGLSLHDLVSQYGPLPAGRAIYLMRQICSGLAEAHALGLVHRDLKPANIFIAVRGGEYDVSKVLDFGLVKLAPNEGAELTADNTVSGTPSFMSPEQATGRRDVDGRSDIYALGAILYFMLTGRPPFEGDNAMAVMIAHARDPVVPPSQYRNDIPAELESVVLRCLRKLPADRYADTRALSRDLAACPESGDWDEDRAEAWWVEQARRALDRPAAEPELTTVQALS